MNDTPTVTGFSTPEETLKKEDLTIKTYKKELIEIVVERLFCKCGTEMQQFGPCYSYGFGQTTTSYRCPQCNAVINGIGMFPRISEVFTREKFCDARAYGDEQ